MINLNSIPTSSGNSLNCDFPNISERNDNEGGEFTRITRLPTPICSPNTIEDNINEDEALKTPPFSSQKNGTKTGKHQRWSLFKRKKNIIKEPQDQEEPIYMEDEEFEIVTGLKKLRTPNFPRLSFDNNSKASMMNSPSGSESEHSENTFQWSALTFIRQEFQRKKSKRVLPKGDLKSEATRSYKYNSDNFSLESTAEDEQFHSAVESPNCTLPGVSADPKTVLGRFRSLRKVKGRKEKTKSRMVGETFGSEEFENRTKQDENEYVSSSYLAGDEQRQKLKHKGSLREYFPFNAKMKNTNFKRKFSLLKRNPLQQSHDAGSLRNFLSSKANTQVNNNLVRDELLEQNVSLETPSFVKLDKRRSSPNHGVLSVNKNSGLEDCIRKRSRQFY